MRDIGHGRTRENTEWMDGLWRGAIATEGMQLELGGQ